MSAGTTSNVQPAARKSSERRGLFDASMSFSVITLVGLNNSPLHSFLHPQITQITQIIKLTAIGVVSVLRS